MKYSAELITIGSELLKGSVLNSNAQYLGRELTKLGFYVANQVACDDVISAIDDRLSEAIVRSHLIIICGGLGPTPDDITREAVADHFGVPLSFSKQQYEKIEVYYKKRNKKVPSIVKKEALFPQNAQPLINQYGIALGFSITYGKRLIIALPGVPSELMHMFQELVKPLVKKHFADADTTYALTVRLLGISEPDVIKKLGKDFFTKDFNFGIYPGYGEITIRLHASKIKEIHKLKKTIQKKLGSAIYSFEEKSLASVIGDVLIKKKKTVGVAESCTGGKLSDAFVSVPGASRFFNGSAVCYSDLVKMNSLGVKAESLKKEGAVSLAVAKQLAVGACHMNQSDYGLGVTGVAGPDGGTEKKPVGTVCIGIKTPKKNFSNVYKFWGTRDQVQMKAVNRALELLWKEIR